MDLAPLLLAGVRDAGSAQLTDRQFKSLLSHADDLIQASLQSAQRNNGHKSASELSAVPGQPTSIEGGVVGHSWRLLSGMCSLIRCYVVHVL